MDVVPGGTSTCTSNISSRSRRQLSSLPFALNLRPVRSTSGPLGMCSPGIHFGYNRSIVPGAAGITRWVWKILRGASLASTAIVVVGAGELVLAFFFCAEAETTVSSRAIALANNHERFTHIHLPPEKAQSKP